VSALDHTHDPAKRSWVAGADDGDFPLQNLPIGLFSPAGGEPRGGIAIGDRILDLAGAVEAGLFHGKAAEAAEAAAGSTLNAFLALGRAGRTALRRRLFELLEAGSPDRHRVETLLHDSAACRLHVPALIGDYTDFYAGIHHATAAGSLFRPDSPLMPNYKYVPVGYHGRSSSVRVSGEAVRRPNGQRKPAREEVPSFGPSRNLDYELELGIWIGPGNALGEPIPIAEAAEHIAGFCLLNDWSARDIQGWEAQPLGPFLAKNFSTSISPWIVTPEALAPFRAAQPPRPEGDPAPLDYLLDETDQAEGALDIDLEVTLTVPGQPAHLLCRSNARYLYWTVAQLLAHHASGGCNLQPGDLFGSGTISGPSKDSAGCLLELTRGGREPVALAGDLMRRFLEDGDEVVFRASCRRDGYVPIGFGECRARILPART